MRMVTLILLSNASSLALEQPGSMVRGMSGRRLLIFFGKLDDLGDAAMRGPEHPAVQLSPGPVEGGARAGAAVPRAAMNGRAGPWGPCVAGFRGALPAPARTAPPRPSTAGSRPSGASPSASATSTTTSPEDCSTPEASDKPSKPTSNHTPYTPKCEEPRNPASRRGLGFRAHHR